MFRRSRQAAYEEGANGQAAAAGAGEPTTGMPVSGTGAGGTGVGGTGVGTGAGVGNGTGVGNGAGVGSGAGSGAAPATTGGAAAGAPVARTVPVERTVPAAPAVVNPGAGATLGTVGILTILLGAWAGIVPFVGPLFGYNANGTKAWVWNTSHALVWLLPGAVAVLMGLMMLSRAPIARTGLGGRGHIWTGLITACCGGWLVFAPVAWRVAEGARVIRPSSAWWQFLYVLGFTFGPGCLLVLLGGMAMGLAALTRRAPAVVSEAVPVRDRAIAA